MIRVEQEIPDQPDVERLFRDADAQVAALYPGVDRAGPTIEALLAADVRFFVARAAGRAVGCAGFTPGGAQDTPRWAELNRVFVDEAFRKQGVAQALLAAMEALATNERFAAMRLETGVRASAALRLYTQMGYTPRAPYGPFAADPHSIFMEKPLGPGRGTG